jgi:hypothetical protein
MTSSVQDQLNTIKSAIKARQVFRWASVVRKMKLEEIDSFELMTTNSIQAATENMEKLYCFTNPRFSGFSGKPDTDQALDFEVARVMILLMSSNNPREIYLANTTLWWMCKLDGVAKYCVNACRIIPIAEGILKTYSDIPAMETTIVTTLMLITRIAGEYSLRKPFYATSLSDIIVPLLSSNSYDIVYDTLVSVGAIIRDCDPARDILVSADVIPALKQVIAKFQRTYDEECSELDIYDAARILLRRITP